MDRGQHADPPMGIRPPGPRYFTTLASFNLQQDGDGTFRLVMESSDQIRFGGYPPNIKTISDSNTTSEHAPPVVEDPLQPFFDRFFPNIAFVTQLGSSITFALIVSQLQDPEEIVAHDHLFDLSTVRIFIAASWLIFTVTLILSFFLLGFLKSRKGASNSTNEGYAIVALLYSLVTAAFISLSLAVAAYVKVVGFSAVALLGTLLSLPVALFCLSKCFAPSSGTEDGATDTDSSERTNTSSNPDTHPSYYPNANNNTTTKPKTKTFGDKVREGQKVLMALPPDKEEEFEDSVSDKRAKTRRRRESENPG